MGNDHSNGIYWNDLFERKPCSLVWILNDRAIQNNDTMKRQENDDGGWTIMYNNNNKL